MPQNTGANAGAVSTDRRDRISYYVDLMKDPANREALALEMVYLRDQDDARRSEPPVVPEVDEARLNELLIQVGPTAGMREDSRDLSLPKLWQFAHLAIAEAVGRRKPAR